jgi:hypothetical protein
MSFLEWEYCCLAISILLILCDFFAISYYCVFSGLAFIREDPVVEYLVCDIQVIVKVHLQSIRMSSVVIALHLNYY